jgi:hypothetical protein
MLDDAGARVCDRLQQRLRGLALVAERAGGEEEVSPRRGAGAVHRLPGRGARELGDERVSVPPVRLVRRHGHAGTSRWR